MPWKDAEKRKIYERERHRRYMNEYRKRKGEGYRTRYWIGSLRRKYGMSLAEFNAMRDSQNNRCAACGAELESEGARRLVIDHCHQSNKVRGLLCCGCNRTIGHAQEDTMRLRKCAEYLEQRK